MFVRGIDLREATLVEGGAEGVRVTLTDGDRRFIKGDAGLEVWEAWHLNRRLNENGK